jgi:predicted TIM-barrel fold metal-dependent hydrolase
MSTPPPDLDWLVSVDDHVLEPPTVWQDRVPSAMKDRAPRLVRDADGEAWIYDGRRFSTFGLSATAGKAKQEFSAEPISYEDMRPGCYDPVERIADMNEAGVLASLCFPSFPRFCGQTFYEATDRDLGLLCVKAYNDWMIEEWCAAAPGRLIPQIIIPLWDPRAAAAEVERCAALGARAVTFSENPVRLGLPSIHHPDRYWDPVLRAVADAELVLCMHIGSSSAVPSMSDEAPALVTYAWSFAAMASGTLCDWLFSSVFQRFPSLQIALSEGGIGWIPYFLERAEQVVDKQRYLASRGDSIADIRTGLVSHRPNEIDFDEFDVRRVFRDHIHGCFIEDSMGVANLDRIGIDNVMMEVDYPHSDSTWPNCISTARAQLSGLSDEDAYKLLRGNAERLFRFTPAVPGISRAVSAPVTS